MTKRTQNGGPAVTWPPGELRYMWMGFEGFSDSKKRSWATTTWAVSSLIGPLMQMILSLRSLENMSYALSPRDECSITIGIRLNERAEIWADGFDNCRNLVAIEVRDNRFIMLCVLDSEERRWRWLGLSFFTVSEFGKYLRSQLGWAGLVNANYEFSFFIIN